MIRGNAIHIDSLLGYSTKEIATTNNNANLAPQRVNGCNFLGYFVNKDGIDAKTAACGQGFARKLEEDSFVHIRTKYRMLQGAKGVSGGCAGDPLSNRGRNTESR